MGDDGVEHPIDQGHVRSRLLLEPEMGKVDQLNPPRICHDEFGLLSAELLPSPPGQ